MENNKKEIKEKVRLLPENDSHIVAIVDFIYENILFRKVEIKEDAEGKLYVEYPTRVRKKKGQIVFNENGEEYHDFIFKPAVENYDYFDVLVMNTFYRHIGEPEIDEIPPLDASTDVSVTPVEKMSNGIIGFAAVLYKGILINDIAITQSITGNVHLIYPHFKPFPENPMNFLYIFPFTTESLQDIFQIVCKEYNKQVDTGRYFGAISI